VFCQILTDCERIVYRMNDPNGIGETQLKEMYYAFNGAYWEKSLPLSALMRAHDLNSLQSNYNRFLEKEVSGSRTIVDFEDTLEKVIRRHAAEGIRWWLTGSAALYIRGLKVHPHDIDVMTYLSEKDKILDAFMEIAVEPFHYPEGWVVKGFGVADSGYRVDYAFEPQDWVDARERLDFGPYAEQHLETVTWKGLSVLVPPLALHLPSNIARNRQRIVDQIRGKMGLAS
jgi:hypothetical protein